jgi:very-short-patch-repair endonuclease
MPPGTVRAPVTNRLRDDRIRALIRTQDGHLSIRQAREAGLSRAEIAVRVRSGEWERGPYGVLRATDHPVTPRSRIRAAMLSLGETATLVGRSAAFWWHLTDIPPAEIEIAMPHGSRARPRAGVRILRRAVDQADRVVVDGVAVTKKPATVLAAATSLGLVAGARLMDRALQTGVDIAQLRRVHVRSSGRYGASLGGELLTLASGGARSEAERTAHRSLVGAGITGWHANREVHLRGYGAAFLDLAFDEQRVLAEIDGWAYHRGLREFLRDAARQNALVLEGWTVIRTNWFELRDDPERFVRNVREALAAKTRRKI